jgi:acyl-CoA reductase-like NAD-dependent aldehyde dehydrogenase
MEKIEPFEMTDAERAAIEADRQARKEWEKAHFDERGDKLRRIWE